MSLRPLGLAREIVNDLKFEVVYAYDDLVFVEMPWIAEPDSSALARWPRQGYANPALERLYALGIDAYRVAEKFVEGVPGDLDLDGATGHLTLEKSRQFVREGRLMRFQDGRATVVNDAGASTSEPAPPVRSETPGPAR